MPAQAGLGEPGNPSCEGRSLPPKGGQRMSKVVLAKLIGWRIMHT